MRKTLTIALLAVAGLAQAGTRYVTDQLETTMRTGESVTHRITRMLAERHAGGGGRLQPGDRLFEGAHAGRQGGVHPHPAADGPSPSPRERLAEIEERMKELQQAPDQLSAKLATLQGEHTALETRATASSSRSSATSRRSSSPSSARPQTRSPSQKSATPCASRSPTSPARWRSCARRTRDRQPARPAVVHDRRRRGAGWPAARPDPAAPAPAPSALVLEHVVTARAAARCLSRRSERA